MSNFSSIRVTVYEKESTRGFATVKVGDLFYITGLRIIEGTKGLFVSMPSRKDTSGEYKDICFPASKEVRDELQGLVLAEWHRLKGTPAKAELPPPGTDDVPF